MIQSPLNNVIVKISTKYIKNYTDIIRAANLNPGSQLNPADLVQIVGEVISVPKEVSYNVYGYEGFVTYDIKPGDTCIFRYDVVFSFKEQKEKDDPIYKNLMWYRGEQYWKADITKIFAVIRDDKIIMVNGYVMLENCTKGGTIVLPQHMKKYANIGSGVVSNIGRNLSHLKRIDVSRGDTVFFNPFILQEYEINKKKFGIIQQKQVLGWQATAYVEL